MRSSNIDIVGRAERAYRRYCSRKGIKCDMECISYTPRTETGKWIHRVQIWNDDLSHKRGEPARPPAQLLAEYRLKRGKLQRIV